MFSSEEWYLVAFANRETADEWWRMISTSSSPYSGIVERISPQLYIQNKSETLHIALFPSNTVLPNAAHFDKKMVITGLNQRYTTKYSQAVNRLPMALPPLTITDHISGAWCVFPHDELVPC